MSSKLGILAVAALFVLAVMYFVSQMAQGLRFFGLLKGIAPLVPFLLAFFFMGKKYWIGLTFGALSLTGLTLPLPVFQNLPLPVLLLGFITLFVMGYFIIEKPSLKVGSLVGFRLMMAAGAIVLVRFLIDRPGSMYFGGKAGGSTAVVYLLAFIAFWAISQVAAEPWDTRKNLHIAILLAMGTLAYNLYTIRHGGLMRITFYLFGVPIFLVVSYFTAWLHEQEAVGRFQNSLQRWTGMLGVLAIVMLSAFRSRILFVLGMFGAVSWRYGRVKKLIALGIFLYVFAFGIVLIGGNRVPLRVSRPLSLFLPVNQSAARQYAREWERSQEMGWESPFRWTLYRLVWGRILQRPIRGHGLGFDVREAIALYQTAGPTEYMQLKAMFGSTHNALLALAMVCGLPAALLFVGGYIAVVRRFVFYTKRDPSDRLLTATLLGYLVMITGQMLVNGAHNELLAVSVVLGVMNGYAYQMKKRVEASSEEEPPSPRKPADVMPHSAIPPAFSRLTR